MWPVHRARPASRGNRAAASARPLHVALPAQLHGRRGARPRGRRRAARDVTRHDLVGRLLRNGTDRSRLPSTRKPDTRPPLADESRAAAGRVRGHLIRRLPAGYPTLTDYPTSRRPPSMKALVSSDKLPASAGPYSPGLTIGDWIFLSGQCG